MSSDAPKEAPLAIEQSAHGSTDTLAVDGTPVKLESLGPMIVNSDGTMSRITNWAEMSAVERDRVMRLLVKKRNIVRMEKTAAEEGGSEPQVTLLSEAKKEEAAGKEADTK